MIASSVDMIALLIRFNFMTTISQTIDIKDDAASGEVQSIDKFTKLLHENMRSETMVNKEIMECTWIEKHKSTVVPLTSDSKLVINCPVCIKKIFFLPQCCMPERCLHYRFFSGINIQMESNSAN